MTLASIRNARSLSESPGNRLTYAVLFGLIVYGAGVLAILQSQAEMQLAIGLLLLVPAILIAVYVVTRALLGERLSGAVVAVICIFITAANFRTRAYDDKSIDWQVGLKLLALMLLLAAAVIFISYAFNQMHFGRLFYAWLLFFGWLVVSSLYSVSVAFALTCSISMLTCYFYAVYMAVWLSRMRAVEIMMLVALLMCVGSIFVYYAVPSMGRMQGWTVGEALGDTGRLKGLTGSANAIGTIAAFALLLAFFYYREFGKFGKRLAIFLVPTALACLVLSNNRSSMVAIVITIWFASVFRSGTSFKLVLSFTGALIGGTILLTFSDEIFSLFSRSGNAIEVTSLTGRTSIWAVVIELWAQRPIFGYGYTSALSILPLDPRLFHVAAHAHNMFLEFLFAGGIVLLAIFVYATYQTFLQMYRLRAINEAALLVFLLIRALTEAGPFGGMGGYTSFAYAMTIALVIAKGIDVRTRTTVPRPLTLRRVDPRLQLPRI